MSREYAKRSKGGSNLPIIIAIVGTVIVVAVILYFVLGNGGTSLFGGATDTPIPIATYTPLANTPTPGPVFTPTAAPTVQVILPSASPDVALITASPTPPPAKVFLSATVWANSLKVREGPGLDYGQVGTVKYGQTFKVYDETTKFIKIQLTSGAYGWIWEDYTVRGDATLPAAPSAEPEASWMTSATLSGSTLTVKFSKGVYGNKEHTVSLGGTDFTVKEGANVVTFTLSHSAGSDTATLALSPTSGGALTVSIAADTVFDVAGDSSPAGSKTTGTSSDTTAPSVSFGGGTTTKTVTATFSESIGSSSDGTGSLAPSDFFVSGAYGVSIVSATSSGKTATITLSYTGMSAGDKALVALNLLANSAYDAGGNSCPLSTYNFEYTEPTP